MRFYLGTHLTEWLERADVPLFVSRRRLARRSRLPRARVGWALDSGGFTELNLYGSWTVSPGQYAAAVRRYRDEIGRLEWAAPQDWMCEPAVLARTGLTVADHQARTVANYLELRAADPSLPIVPVLQGWTLADYHRCADLYAAAGVDLAAAPLVGVGTVCRRQHTPAVAVILTSLAGRGLRLHGFGVKGGGFAAYAHALASADSLAWSVNGRRDPPLPGCTHANCANCYRYALRWRTRTLARIGPQQLTLEVPA